MSQTFVLFSFYVLVSFVYFSTLVYLFSYRAYPINSVARAFLSSGFLHFPILLALIPAVVLTGSNILLYIEYIPFMLTQLVYQYLEPFFVDPNCVESLDECGYLRAALGMIFGYIYWGILAVIIYKISGIIKTLRRKNAGI